MSHVTTSCPLCDTLNRVDLAGLGDGPRCVGCGQPLLLDRAQPIPGEALDRVIAEAEAPLLDEFARDRAGEVLVGKLDTDRYPYAAVCFKVRGIPTLIAFAGGREVARQVGAVPRSGLDALLEAVGEAL